MNCDLCHADVIKGTMYHVAVDRWTATVCDICASRVRVATSFEVNEAICDCGKLPAAICEARLDKENCGAVLAARQKGET
jgi:hypothetical protein